MQCRRARVPEIEAPVEASRAWPGGPGSSWPTAAG